MLERVVEQTEHFLLKFVINGVQVVLVEKQQVHVGFSLHGEHSSRAHTFIQRNEVNLTKVRTRLVGCKYQVCSLSSFHKCGFSFLDKVDSVQ